MNYEDNPNSIKYYVKKYLTENKDLLQGQKVIDFPAGNGITSKIISNCGGIPLAFDLFPEYFNIKNLKCERTDIREGIPVANQSTDMLICQEGIEHFSDQLAAIKEFNRVLKMNGIMLLTTPNYSNLRSKLSYLLSESERFNKTMPPNEFDSIWMSNQSISKEIYLGHIFLLGIQKLRLISKLSGFKIKKIHRTKTKSTSVFLLLIFYPFIFLSNYYTYKINKNKSANNIKKISVYKELFKLSVNIGILTDSHLMVEFEKIAEVDDVYNNLQSINKQFGTT